MTTQITKFQQQEKIRRLWFKHRGNINAIIEETGFDENYIRTVTKKISKSFKRDVSFEIACFVTEALLSGREQRLIILEDRLKEVLGRKRLESICCSSPISEHTHEGSTWYKCKKCGSNCEVQEVDLTNDVDVVRLIDRMRKEDEFIGKFVATMGIIAKGEEKEPAPQIPSPPAQYVESKELSPPEKKLKEKMEKLPASKKMELRRYLEEKVDEAIDELCSK